MELNREEAESIAVAYLNSRFEVLDDELILQTDKTIERDYGWFFLSTSRKYQETGDFHDMVVGNGWLLVVRRTGDVIPFSTAYALEDCIKQYEHDVGLQLD